MVLGAGNGIGGDGRRRCPLKRNTCIWHVLLSVVLDLEFCQGVFTSCWGESRKGGVDL